MRGEYAVEGSEQEGKQKELVASKGPCRTYSSVPTHLSPPLGEGVTLPSAGTFIPSWRNAVRRQGRGDATPQQHYKPEDLLVNPLPHPDHTNSMCWQLILIPCKVEAFPGPGARPRAQDRTQGFLSGCSRYRGASGGKSGTPPWRDLVRLQHVSALGFSMLTGVSFPSSPEGACRE